MVQVGDVGVCVNQRLVEVLVGVPDRYGRMVMLVVDVVFVLVRVLHRQMAVFVLVA